jgi:hypothetical protein
MSVTKQLAKQLRAVHFGGNWTDSYLKQHLADVTWQQAVAKVDSLNTIATLVYHMNYYLNAVLGPLENKPLSAKHAYSLNVPPINSTEEWQQMLEKMWADAERFATLVEQFPEDRLWETFFNEKYGNYYRNIQGVTEHCHYHLGQIVLIKKLLAKGESAVSNT